MAKFLDLCAGVGAFRMASEQLNHKAVGYVEFDKFPRRSYEAIYDTKDEWTAWDLRDVTNEDWKGFRGEIDYITAGFPCQSFSVAGKGLGFEDTRGTVFFEVARAIKYTSPKYFVLENVKNLISHDKGKTMDTIVKTLNDMDYTIDYTILNSKYYDVPQNRERVFIIGIKGGKTEEWETKGTNALAKSKRRIASYPWVRTFNFNWPQSDVVTKQLVDILEPEEDVPENLYLSPDKTKTLIESILKRDEKLGRTDALRMLGLLDMKGQDSIRRVYDPLGIAPTLTTMGGGNREPKILVAGNVNPSGRGMNGQVYEAKNGLSPTLSTNKGEGVKIAYCPIINPDRVNTRQNGRRLKSDGEEMFTLTVQDRHGIIMYEMKQKVIVRKHDVDTEGLVALLREHKKQAKLTNKQIAERLKKPITLVEHWFRTDKSFAVPDASIWFSLKELLQIETNEFDAQVTEFIEKDNEYDKSNRVYDAQGIAPTLTSTNAAEKIYHNFVVRKLTPKECWRLQAFPDWAYDKAAEVNSPSQLYKQAGNALTVTVAYEIIKRLID